MAAFITYNDVLEGEVHANGSLTLPQRVTKVWEWHIGEQLHPNLSPHDVISIQAHGQELVWITDLPTNLPDPCSTLKGIWFGDDAKFIVANVLQ